MIISNLQQFVSENYPSNFLKGVPEKLSHVKRSYHSSSTLPIINV